MKQSPPISIVILACLYLFVGGIGFFYHFHDLYQPDFIWIETTEALAVVIGIFLLRRQNWARWLAIAWMVFHVVISYGDFREFIIHICILAIIVWLLFRADARRYFRGRASAS